MTMNALDLYETKKSIADFLFIVYFRGHWCPFCLAWLHDLESLRSRVEADNGTILAVTAEADSELGPCREIFHGTIVSDPEHDLANHLRQSGLVDVAISSKSGSTNGMAQPAVLVMRKDKRLFSWACVPSTMNIGGARDRPSLRQVTDNILAQIEGRSKPHAEVMHQSLFWNGFKSKLFG